MPISRIRVEVEANSIKNVAENLDTATARIFEALPYASASGETVITEDPNEPKDATTHWKGRKLIYLDVSSPVQPDGGCWDGDIDKPGVRFIAAEYAWSNGSCSYGVFDRTKQNETDHLIAGDLPLPDAELLAEMLNSPQPSREQMICDMWRIKMESRNGAGNYTA